ncbi:MAG TPA: hypothetical protein VFA49_09285 [Chloroflexota bacterium]|nr:hypothetical protein [Chloroflexota bacterium]
MRAGGRRTVRVGTVVFLLALSLAIGVLVRRGWPLTANASMYETLDRLRASRVPVFVVIPQQPRETHSTVEPDGFSYTIVRGDPLIVRGRRTAVPDTPATLSSPGRLTWSNGGVTYTITAESDLKDGPPAALMERVIPLELALRQGWGFGGDSPLLYLLYVPVLVAFAGWVVWSALTGDWRTPRQEADVATR